MNTQLSKFMWFVILVALLATHAALLVIGSRRNFVVLDEVGHVPAGVAHWQTGTFGLYRVNPPLARMLAALPVLAARPHTKLDRMNLRPGVRSDWDVGRDFAEVNQVRYFDLICLARLPGVLWSLLGLVLIYRWGKELYGRAAGCLAATLWCFDPTALAFAQVVTPDIPASVAGLAATYAFWKYLRRPGWSLALLSGLLLGIAQLTKFSMLALYGIWPMIALAHAFGRRGDGRSCLREGNRRLRLTIQLTAILVISLDVINLGYGMAEVGRPLGGFTFTSRTFRGATDETGTVGASENRFRGSWLSKLPVPLPAEFLQGIDAQRRDFESHLPSYLAGHWRERGWYHYYLYALAVKVPVGTWVLVLWGLALVAIRHPASAPWAEEATLLLPAGVFLAFISSQDGFNHHMRYVLPMFPFLAIATGKLAYFLRPGHGKAGLATLVFLTWSVASSLAVFPHSMSHFNEVAGGPLHGHDHLLDSNIDWGQDLLELKNWLDQHPEARPLHLAYFHFLDPGPFLGIDYRLPPMGPAGPRTASHVAPYVGPHPGYYAVSVNYLRGMTFQAADGRGGWQSIARHDSLAYFRGFTPIARAGYSIYIYKITLDQANAVRRQLGLPPLTVDSRGMDATEVFETESHGVVSLNP